MKCLGLIGGPCIELLTHYARHIEDEIGHRFGRDAHANLLTFGLPTLEVNELLKSGDWSGLGRLLARAAASLRDFGAEKCLVCAPALAVAAARHGDELDLLSPIASVLAPLESGRIRRVGLVGTRWPEEEQLWRQQLNAAGVHDVLLPVPRDRQHLATLLAEKLEHGIVDETSRADVIRIVYSLRQAGARALIVCAPPLTAILEDSPPVLATFDVTELHALAAVEWVCAATLAT